MDTNFLSIVVSQVENKCGLNFINQKFSGIFSVRKTKTHKNALFKRNREMSSNCKSKFKVIEKHNFKEKKCHRKKEEGSTNKSNVNT